MKHTLILLASILGLGACTSTPNLSKLQNNPNAIVNMQSTKNNTAKGFINFVQDDDKILVSGRITGLKANSEHGFHIHEKSACGEDGMSAGGHFNPTNKPHGNNNSMNHHAGDMPSIRADNKGEAVLNFETKGISITNADTSIMGRSVIIHRDADDYTTQPTGNSGPRLACGIITK